MPLPALLLEPEDPELEEETTDWGVSSEADWLWEDPEVLPDPEDLGAESLREPPVGSVGSDLGPDPDEPESPVGSVGSDLGPDPDEREVLGVLGEGAVLRGGGAGAGGLGVGTMAFSPSSDLLSANLVQKVWESLLRQMSVAGFSPRTS